MAIIKDEIYGMYFVCMNDCKCYYMYMYTYMYGLIPSVPPSPTPRLSSTSRTLLHSPSSSSSSSSPPLPRVMFTGVVDPEGERTVKALGGELVDSVYDCTHLVTDKVSWIVRYVHVYTHVH